jgi:antitoxin VapB
MIEVHSKTFRSGNSVAVRMPKEVAFDPDIEVVISRVGDVVTIMPRDKVTPAELVRRLREIGPPPDGVQKREKIIFPKHHGL